MAEVGHLQMLPVHNFPLYENNLITFLNQLFLLTPLNHNISNSIKTKKIPKSLKYKLKVILPVSTYIIIIIIVQLI